MRMNTTSSLRRPFTKCLPRILAGRIAIAASASFFLNFAHHSSAVDFLKADNAENLNLGISWLGDTAPGVNDVAVWDSTVLGANTTVLGANLTLGGIRIANPGGLVTIGAGSTLSLLGSGIDMSAATQDLTINAAIALGTTANGSFAQTWNVATGRTLTVATAPVRNGNANNLSVGGVLNITGAGTTKIGTVALPLIVDGGNNPFVTFNSNDWAATDATGTVIAATYTNDAFTGNANIVTANTYAINGATPASVRFANTAGPVIVNNTGTSTLRGILMAAGAQNVTINNNFIRPNRVSVAGATMSFIQNSVAGDLIINTNIGNASSGAPVSITKSGVGRMILAAASGYSGLTFIHEGTLQIGNGGTTGSIQTNTIFNNSSLVVNRNDAVTLSNAISGTGSVTQAGADTLTLSGANTYTGATNLNSGAVAFNAATNLGNGGAINFNGGTLRYGAAHATDISTRVVSIGAPGGILDTNGNNLTFASSIGAGGSGSLTKTGAGTLTLNAGSSHTGTTILTTGALIANGSMAGGATVSNGTTLSGTANFGGTITVNSGGTLNPGNSVGTITTNALTLASGSTLNFEFNTTPANDYINVTGTNGLTLNGGGLNLFVEGSISPFSTVGTYNLIGYTGSIGGTGTNALSVLNPQPAKTYTFGSTASNVTLKIESSGFVSGWNVATGGGWGTGTNWNAGVPDQIGAVANMTFPLAAPDTVTLDAPRTVGAMSFDSAQGYTIAAGTGGTLTFNNGVSQANIIGTTGSHAISAPIILNSNTVAAIASGAAVTFAGPIGGASSLTKSGAGLLDLTNATNGLTGPITITGGTLGFSALGSIGAGALIFDGGTLRYNAGNTADISGRVVTLAAGGGTINTNGNDATFANPIGNGGAGGLTKSGAGTLTLAPANTQTGATTITGGSLAISTNDGLGAPAAGAGITLDGGTLVTTATFVLDNAGANARPITVGAGGGAIDVAAASTFTLPGTLNGTGILTKAGTGTLVLPNATTFAGGTVINAGAVQLGNGAALATSPLTVNSAAGLLFANGITAATLPSLAGTGSFDLTNDLTAPVTLTVGSAASANFAGAIGGLGGLTKVGIGTQTLTGLNTYTGGTLVSGGVLQIGTGGGITGGPASVAAVGGSQLVVNGGTLAATGTSTIGNGSLGFLLSSGSASLGPVTMNDNTNNTTLVRIDGGTFSADSFTMRRNASAVVGVPAAGFTNLGVYVTGGTVTLAGGMDLGNGNAASNVGARFDGGTVTIGGVVTIGGTHGARYGVLDVNGATFTSTDAVTGVLVGTGATNPDYFLIRAGTATVERIQLGAGTNGSTSEVNLSGGSLYVGSGGIVQGSTGATFVASVRLGNATLGAKADWTSSLGVTLTGNVTGGVTIKAADAADVAHDITLNGVLSGTGALTKAGAGKLILGGANTFTGSTLVTLGTLELANVNALAGSSLETDGAGTVTFAVTGNSTYHLGGLKGANALNAGTNSLSVGANNESTTLAGSLTADALTKVGAGTLTLANPTNTLTGNTTITTGTLALSGASTNNLGASPTVKVGAGATLNVTGLTAATLALASGQTLTGTGTVTGGVSAGTGAALSPGNFSTGSAGPGTLTLGDLSLTTGSTLNFGLSSGNLHGALTTAASLLSVQALSVGAGVGINLFQPNTTLQYATNGVYDLFQAVSAPTGATLNANFTILNPVAGGTYSFDYDGTFVKLSISGLALAGLWNVDADGVWSLAGNWSGGIPGVVGDSAIFGSTITAPRTVTLDSARTISQVTLSSAQAYTIGGASTLTLDGGANPATVMDDLGSHTIAAPVSLNTNLSVSVANAADTLTMSGVVGNASGTRTITKTGPGTLVLSNTNTYGPAAGGVGTILSAGRVRVGANGALGAGDLSVTDNAMLQAGATGLNVPNAVAIAAGKTLTVDPDLGTLQLSGAITELASAGALTKISAGTLILSGANTNTGATTVAAGTLQLGNGGTSGTVAGPIANAGAVVFNRSDDWTLPGPISGTGTVTQAGTGNTTLGADSTFTGQTVISAGTLTLGSALALQGSTLNYNNQGGTLGFGTLTAATLANLTGAQNLALENTLAGGVVLSIGGNGQNVNYTGVLSGPGGVTKLGAGTFAVNNAHTYTGNTLVSGGILQIDVGGSIAGGAASVAAAAGARLIVNGGTLTASAVSNVGSGSLGLLVQGGSATFNAGLTTDVGVSNGNLIAVTGGTLTSTFLNLGRTGLNLSAEPAAGVNNNGLYINGGAVNITGALNMGTAATANSSVNARIDAGSLTVGGALTIGLNNGGRWSVVDINGGTFTSTDAVNGVLVGGPFAGNAVLLIRAGISNVERLQLGQGGVTGTTVLNLTGGSLYLGSGGIVKGGSANTVNLKLAAGTLGAKADWASDQEFTLNGGTIIKAADAADVARDISLSGALTGAGGFTKTGTGRLALSGTSNYTGATNVSAGTLEISGSLSGTVSVTSSVGGSVLLAGAAADRVANTTAVNLEGGHFGFAPALSNASESLGALSITASSTLDFGSGDTNLLLFSGLSLGGSQLSIYNWNGVRYANGATEDDGGDVIQDRLLFAGSTLAGNALQNVLFYSDNGSTFVGFGHEVTYAGFYELVPIAVPEPSSLGLLGGIGLLGVSGRRFRGRRSAK